MELKSYGVRVGYKGGEELENKEDTKVDFFPGTGGVMDREFRLCNDSRNWGRATLRGRDS